MLRTPLTLVGLSLEELLNLVPRAPLGRGPPEAISGRWVGPLGEQQGDDLHVPAAAGVVERRVPVLVHGVRVGTSFEEQPGDFIF